MWVMAKKQEVEPSNGTVRVTLRLPAEDYDKLTALAEHNKLSINKFVSDIIDFYQLTHYGNYELPSLEIQRLNQIVERLDRLELSHKTLTKIVVDSFSDLLKLTHGDNYLLEAEETGDF